MLTADPQRALTVSPVTVIPATLSACSPPRAGATVPSDPMTSPATTIECAPGCMSTPQPAPRVILSRERVTSDDVPSTDATGAGSAE